MHIRISNDATPRDVNSTVPACPDQNQLFGSGLNYSRQPGSAGLVWYARMIDLKGLEALKVRHHCARASFMLR
jgi:hypothetical protein